MKLNPYFSFIKACHHLSLSWSNICTCICYEVASSFAFVTKLHQYSSFIIKLPWHFICIEATPILIFAMKPRQHFIHTKAVSSFIFAMKPHQHFVCIETRHQDFSDANKTLKMQGVANKILNMQGVPIKTLKKQGNTNKILKMREKMLPRL